MSNQARSRARRWAVQALYQWQLAGLDAHDIEQQFVAERDKTGIDIPYFRKLLHQVVQHVNELDDLIAPLLDRPVYEVDPVERGILRIGVYELAFQPDIPFRVVINEAVELAKTFGAENGHKYVNGILDAFAARQRPQEVGVGAKKNAARKGR